MFGSNHNQISLSEIISNKFVTGVMGPDISLHKHNTKSSTYGVYALLSDSEDKAFILLLRLRHNRARAVQNVLGNVYLSSLTKHLCYEQREQLHSGGGGALSQGAGHVGSFYRYAV